MEHPLSIYNTLTRKKEQFVPLHEPHVGMCMYADLQCMAMPIWVMPGRPLHSICCSAICRTWDTK